MNIPQQLLKYFEIYPNKIAPFMHKQLTIWFEQKPLAGLKVLHNVPVVANTLTKIACLMAAGAEVTVTNPSFMSAHLSAVVSLKEAGISYIENIRSLRAIDFDLFFDCGAELYQTLGRPKLGLVELTGSGDQFLREQMLSFPTVSIDRSLTKQLETVFGCAESGVAAISQLTEQNLLKKTWLIFGFGKIGRGLAYHCVKHQLPVVIVDIDHQTRVAAESLGIKAINPLDYMNLKKEIIAADIIVTATGKKSVLDPYPKSWFQDKILANMGILDE